MTPRKIDPSQPRRPRGREAKKGFRDMKQTAFWCEPATIEAAKEAAKTEGETLSAWIRRAIEAELQRKPKQEGGEQ